MAVPIGPCAAARAAGDSLGPDRTFVDAAAIGNSEPDLIALSQTCFAFGLRVFDSPFTRSFHGYG